MSATQRHDGSTHRCKYHGELFGHRCMLSGQCVRNVIWHSRDVSELRRWVRIKRVIQCELLGYSVECHGWRGVLLEYCECAQVVGTH
eukprot:9954435-Alexandrium_andersonii.AAC.1